MRTILKNITEKKFSKVVVTGGAGFVGSHLCEYLIKNYPNCEVYSIDDYSSGSIQNHINGVQYIEDKASNIHKIIDFCPSHIFHLGEYSRVEASFNDIDKVFDSNMKSIYNILKFVKDTDAKLIYSGSSTKFGDNGLNKDTNPYAWTKSTNTELIINYASWFKINYAISYFYNVYGGREIGNGNYATVVGIFKKQYIENKPLEVVLPGSQKRNFTHIEDIVNALVLIGLHGSGDNYGIGAEEEISVKELAELFNKDIKFLPERRGNRLSADLKTEKTKSLGWSQTKKIKDHIKKFISDNNE